MNDKPKIAGKIGAEPPPHAPKESTLDSRPMTTQELEKQMRVAAAHEKPLPAFDPPASQQIRLPPGVTPQDPDAVAQFQAWTRVGAPSNWDAEAFRAAAVPFPDLSTAVPRGTSPVEDVRAQIGALEAQITAEEAISAENSRNFAENRPNPADLGVELVGSDAALAVEQAFVALQAARAGEISPPAAPDPLPPEPPKHQPAASDSESPSRGIPRFDRPQDLQPTGGFGVAAAGSAGEYIPLDGSELCKLAQALLVDLAEKIPNDLRFSVAVCYPRVRCRVELIVESYPGEGDFRLVRHAAEGNREASLELARRLSDETVFVVVNQRQEIAADGRAESPANAIRGEIGLEIPRKQVIETGGGRLVVDRRG